METITPINRLQLFLKVHRPEIAVFDVKISAKAGFIEVVNTKELISIKGVGYGRKNEQGKHISINQLWEELHDYFQVRIEKTKDSGLITVIRWGDRYFSYDKNNPKKKGQRHAPQKKAQEQRVSAVPQVQRKPHSATVHSAR